MTPQSVGRDTCCVVERRSPGRTDRPACEDRLMPRRFQCYVASPLGFNEGAWNYYRRVYLPALRTAIADPRLMVDPWRDMGDKWDPATNDPWKNCQNEDERHAASLKIGRRNARDIRKCDWLVAYLEGQEPDSGTVVEVGYAAGRGMKCFGLRSDTRRAGEPGVALNLQVETIIIASGGAMYDSLDALVEGLWMRLPAFARSRRTTS